MSHRLRIANDRAHGGLSPDEKAAHLRAIGPHRALMIGDGANDSLAFNHSLCTGTPAIDRGLMEQKAHFYLLGRSHSIAGQMSPVLAAILMPLSSLVTIAIVLQKQPRELPR